MKLRSYSYTHHDSDSAISAASENKTGGIHPTYELLYLISGTFQLHWLGEQYEVSLNSLYILTPNTPHDLIITSTKAVFWYIELTEADKESLFPKLHNILMWNRLQSGFDPSFRMSSLMQLCLDGVSTLLSLEVHNQPYAEELLMLDVKKILLMVHGTLQLYEKDLKLNKNTALPLGYSLSKEVIQTLARFMESNYKHKTTLKELTNISNFQATYLIKRFKEETGYTPIDYLLELRMEAAKAYLTTTEMTIQKVAEETGYPNIHHFSGEFKRKTGLSPTNWRKKG